MSKLIKNGKKDINRNLSSAITTTVDSRKHLKILTRQNYQKHRVFIKNTRELPGGAQFHHHDLSFLPKVPCGGAWITPVEAISGQPQKERLAYKLAD